MMQNNANTMDPNLMEQLESVPNILWIIILVILFASIKGLNEGIAGALAKFKYRKEFQKKLSTMLGNKPNAFSDGNIEGRKWFSELVAEAHMVADQLQEDDLVNKARPAPKAAETVAEFKNKHRELRKQLKFLEYQIKTYEEFFPIIEDFGDQILDDDSFLNKGTGQEDIEKVDPVLAFLQPKEFAKLPTAERNQRALDRYKNKNHNRLEIGRFYERYIGYLYEKNGWKVRFSGILKGYEDLGRDLHCFKDGVVQSHS